MEDQTKNIADSIKLKVTTYRLVEWKQSVNIDAGKSVFFIY